jgi:hypothetical protein
MNKAGDEAIYDIAYQRGRADERKALSRGIERCTEHHPEGGQCELRVGHALRGSEKHLAGMIMWEGKP